MFSHVSVNWVQVIWNVYRSTQCTAFNFLFSICFLFSMFSLFKDFLWFLQLITYFGRFYCCQWVDTWNYFFLSKLEKNYNMVCWWDHCIFIYESLKFISPEPWKLMLISNYQTIEYKFVKAWKMEWICIIKNLVFLFSDSTHPPTHGYLSPWGGSV